MVEQVESAQEALSIQFERATREHALKLERLDDEYATKADALQHACSELENTKAQLTDEIAELSQLHEAAGSISTLREELETRETAAQRQLQELDEQLESAEFDKTKRLKDLHRQQELEVAELEAQHKKQIIQLDRQAANELLAALDLVAVEKADWERYQQAGPAEAARSEEEIAGIREQTRDAFRREYHITTQEPLDVTELFYDHKALSAEANSLRNQIEKLEQEIRRMREHIEHEPQRIATAVEAAKVQIQNNIEQAGVR
jgi:flagellar capping protein FliD